MDERVWEKTAQFLKELRCEDTGRLSQLQLPEYQKAMKEKFSYQPIYEQTVCEMTDEQKCVIEKYVQKKKTNKLICREWWICCFYYPEAEY